MRYVWLFIIFLLTATTAVRFFRVDQGQEHLHYITDISSEDLYILDPELTTRTMLSQASISTVRVGRELCIHLISHLGGY